METHLSIRSAASVLGCAAALLAGVRLGADEPAEHDAFVNFDNYIRVSGYAPWISGDGAAFQQRAGQPTAGTFGIEDFAYAKDLSNDVNLKIVGRALSGAEDYLANAVVTDAKYGTLDVGYKRFRIFYDGVGGFFPTNNYFLALSPERLHVDRSSFWATAKFARETGAQVTVSFRDEIRTGSKDSTEWGLVVNPGAVVNAGVLSGTTAPANTLALAPNQQALAEHHKTLEGAVTDTFGKTTETLKVIGNWIGNVDTRYYTRYQNSTVIANAPGNVIDDQEINRSRSFRVLSQTETELSDKVAIEVGLTYFHLGGSDGGQWVTPAFNATANTIFAAMTAGNVYATPQVNDYVANAFLKLTPTANWRLELGFREESEVIADQGSFITTTLATGSTSVIPANITTAVDPTYSHETDHVATPELLVQYLGITRVSLYGEFDDQINRGTQHWINPYAATTTTGAGVVTLAPVPVGSVFFQDDNIDARDAKVGANWNAGGPLSVRAEIFRKDHFNRFLGASDVIGTGNNGALFVTGYTFTGAKLSVILKPAPQWTFNTCYLPQAGNMSVTANVPSGGTGNEAPSGKLRQQSISETIGWSPYKQLYFQGSLNLVYNYIQTAYPTVVVSTTAAIPSPIHNADNNYVVGSLLCGFVLDRRTDAQIEGDWQHATNYNPAIAAGGIPYGATYLDEAVTAGLKRKLTDRLFFDGKLGYLRRTDGTTGGFTNYRGPLAYASLVYSL